MGPSECWVPENNTNNIYDLYKMNNKFYENTEDFALDYSDYILKILPEVLISNSYLDLKIGIRILKMTSKLRIDLKILILTTKWRS